MTESDRLLFSSKPRSFKMDRRSRAASRLKAAVLNKLVEFLDNYTDDDLAEYIVVLVCNGKHQHQARDDLDAFLGNSSGKFVSWLWNHLSEELCSPEPCATVQPLVEKNDSRARHASDLVREAKGAREMGSHTHHQLSNGDRRLPLINSHTKPPASAIVSKAFQSLDSGNRPPCADPNSKDSPQRMPKVLSSVAVIEKPRKTAKTHHITDDDFSEISCHSDKAGLNSEDLYQKIAVSETSAPPQHPPSSSIREFSSRNEQSITTEKSQAPSSTVNVGRLSTQVIDSQIGRRRVSVWDRLGKPCEVNHDSNDANDQNFFTAATKRRCVRQAENWTKEHMLVVKEEDGIKWKGEDPTRMTKVREHPANIMLVNDTHELPDSVQAADNSNRRFQLKVKCADDSVSLSSEKETESQIQAACEKVQQSAPIYSDPSPGSTELRPVLSNASSFRNSKLLSNPSGNSEASRATLNTQLSKSSLLTAKLARSGSISMSSNQLPVKNDISEFDSQLHKVKKTIYELHTKQVEISKDAKGVLLGSTQYHGVQNQHADDVEGRTLLVANVHFAAPKETLSLHFSKFGPVVKVTLLMDSMSGMPKGCAYVVFRYKDSAEKALILNGTSFYSRTLKVMWKADMPEDYSGSGQWGAKSLKYTRSQGIGSFHFHKQHYAPHLKWEREHQRNEENLGHSETSSKQG